MKRKGPDGRFQRTMTGERDCEHCGETFMQRAKTQRFCSRSCAYAVRRGNWTGANNPRFNGGLSQWPNGRTVVCCSDGSIVTYARALMEAHLRRALRSDEVVHHLNGDHTDDRVENLQVLTRAEHIDIHRPELLAAQRARSAA